MPILSKEELNAWENIFPDSVNPFGRDSDMVSSLYEVNIRGGEIKGDTYYGIHSFSLADNYDALVETLKTKSKIYVYENDEKTPSYLLSLKEGTNMPQLSDKLDLTPVESPSILKRFANWITGGKAYRREFEQYNKYKALDNEIKSIEPIRKEAVEIHQHFKEENEKENKLKLKSPELIKEANIQREKVSESSEFKKDRQVIKAIIGLSKGEMDSMVASSTQGVDKQAKGAMPGEAESHKRAVEIRVGKGATNKMLTEIEANSELESKKLWKEYTGEKNAEQLNKIAGVIKESVDNILKYTELDLKKYPEVMTEYGKRLENVEEMLKRRPVLSEAVNALGYRKNEVKDFIQGSKIIENTTKMRDFATISKMEPEQIKETIVKNVLVGVILDGTGPKGRTLSDTLESLGTQQGQKLIDKISESSWVNIMANKIIDNNISNQYLFENGLKYTTNHVVKDLHDNITKEKAVEKVAQQKKSVDKVIK